MVATRFSQHCSCSGCGLRRYAEQLCRPDWPSVASRQLPENGIKRVLTPRESETLIAGAEDPKPSDLVVEYSDYVLGESDALQISIDDFIQGGGHPLWQVTLEVSPTGFISLPQLGMIKAAGLTESQLQHEIEERIKAADILKKPIVQVLVPLKRMQYFSITGSVSQPGTYPISAKDFRLLDAIGAARDIGAEASKLYVIRRVGKRAHNSEAPATPPPAAPARDNGLVIPPPTEEGSMSAAISASALVGAQETKPAAAPLPDDDMDSVLSPGRTAGVDGGDAGASVRRFQLKPMIFDPSHR